MARYLGLFVTEAADHLAKVAADLVRLEAVAREGGDVAALVDELFRHVHSVKGMSASLELDGIAALAHRAEDLVGALRGGGLPDAASTDTLLAAVDGLTAMLEHVRAGVSPDPDPALLARLAAARKPAEPAGTAGTAERAPAERSVSVEVEIAPDCAVPSARGYLVVKKLERLGTVRRSAPSAEDLRAGRFEGGRLEVALATASAASEVERTLALISDLQRIAVREEPASGPRLVAAEEAAPAWRGEAVPDVAPASPGSDAGRAQRTVRVRAELLDAFLDGVGELILATARLREIGRSVPEAHRGPLDDGLDRLHVTVKELHEQVMAVRMTPLSVATERLPRAARDVARRVGKQVEVEVRGAEIEIDRAILDELAEPILHVIRNAVDHGICTPEERARAGKPPVGRITVTGRRERDRVLLEIADDGRGMDPDALRRAAVARGALDAAAAAALTHREALLLACLPGISTARELTEVSGRGVGMDAVKRTVETLGGTLDVESAPGAGTRWTFRLPLTVAVQPVLLVSVGGEVVGIPLSKVYGAARLEPGSLAPAEELPPLWLEGKSVPVRELGDLLGFGTLANRATGSVVVAEVDGARMGLAVDALLGQQDAVLKPLLRPFDQVPGLSAVTVLATGRPVFVLDVQRLVAA